MASSNNIPRDSIELVDWYDIPRAEGPRQFVRRGASEREIIFLSKRLCKIIIRDR